MTSHHLGPENAIGGLDENGWKARRYRSLVPLVRLNPRVNTLGENHKRLEPTSKSKTDKRMYLGPTSDAGQYNHYTCQRLRQSFAQGTPIFYWSIILLGAHGNHRGVIKGNSYDHAIIA